MIFKLKDRVHMDVEFWVNQTKLSYKPVSALSPFSIFIELVADNLNKTVCAIYKKSVLRCTADH
jgi:hypothetical protein